MGKAIKGITVEIGGDTSKLDKALKGVDSTSRDLQKELKGVNTLLKLDPSNVELIKQKQDILTKSIESTSERLDILKNTQKQVQAQFDEGKVTEEQYRDFQREIVNTENKLKELTKEANKFGKDTSASILSAKEKLNDFGNKSKEIGKKISVVGAGITAVGVASVGAFNAVDDGADNVIRATGATGEAAKELEETYKSVASNIVGDFSSMGSAIGEINTRFGYTGSELETCSEKFLKFSEITGVDATQAVQLVSRAMGDAGIDSSEYSNMLDALAVAAQASGISIESLTESITKYGAPMRALGFDTKESIAIFSSWELAGVNTEIAFSGMKKAIGAWGKQGKDAREEFKKTLEEIKNAPDIAAATAMSIEIFGQKAGPDLADAIKGGRFEFEEMLNKISNSSGIVDSTFDGLVDGGYDAELAAQNAKMALAELGEMVVTTLSPVFQSAAEILRNITSYISGLPEPIQQVIVIVGIILIALGPLLMIIGQISLGISALGPLLTLLTSPVGIAIVIIGALVAAFLYMWDNCEGFRQFWMDLWDHIKNQVVLKVEAIKLFFTEIIPNFIESAKNKTKQIGTAIKDGFNDSINWIKSLPDMALQWGRDFIQGLINGIRSKMQAMTDAVVGVGNKIKSYLHFSVPDEGPLTDYETWMPDFMEGLAMGINKNKKLVTNAINGLSTEMSVGIQYGSPKSLSSESNNLDNKRANRNMNFEIPVIIEGKEVARAIAPYQDVFDDYYYGR